MDDPSKGEEHHDPDPFGAKALERELFIREAGTKIEPGGLRIPPEPDWDGVDAVPVRGEPSVVPEQDPDHDHHDHGGSE